MAVCEGEKPTKVKKRGNSAQGQTETVEMFYEDDDFIKTMVDEECFNLSFYTVGELDNTNIVLVNGYSRKRGADSTTIWVD